uniref:Uncharacterized protein n=1 Tax=Tanacetum cinerariifolium TaxID=118510 RepID=A0A699IX07_TANCI|nr:hypothetical protein [Tanacetum cinerariifolium]
MAENLVPLTHAKQKMKDGYGDGDVTIHPTQIFSVNNWALKPNQPEGPPFTAHMVGICNAEKPMAFKAPRTSLQTEKKIYQGTKPRAKAGHKKLSTSFKHPPMSNSDATKGRSFKAPTGSKNGPSRKRNNSCSIKDSNPSQLPVSTLVNIGMLKKDQQAADGPTSLRVTSKEGAHPLLSSSMSTFTNVKPIYSDSVIIHFESASGYDASADPIAGTSAPIDSLPPQQGKDKGTKNYSLDHLFAGTNPNVLANKTKSISDGLEIVLTTPETGTSNAAKPKDDPIILVDDTKEDEEEDKNEEIHSTTNDETSQKHIQETKKIKAEAKIARLKAQPPSPNDLEDLPTKLEEFTISVTSLTSEVAELKTLQWELPVEFFSILNQVASVQAKLKTLDALPSLFLKKIEGEAKAEAARHKGKIWKEELIDLLSPEVASDLHLGEWREVVIACPNKKGKGWTPIYKQIQKRMDYLRTTKVELGIDLDRPLSEQDPLDRLDDLENKKTKHADDIHNFFRANKRLKSSV